MDAIRKAWILSTAQAANAAEHVWANMAACEAALESGYGGSGLAKSGNNLFGTKQHVHPVYGTLSLPTREFLKGEWVVVNANWVSYPTLADCFADRMNTLRRLAGEYPHYAAALAATDATTYAQQVSQSWSTDPNRAAKVIEIYQAAGFQD